MGDSRRRFKRAGFHERVGILTRRSFEFAIGHEISEGGMLLQTQINVEVGERIEVHLLVPGQSYFSVTGHVVYVREQPENPNNGILAGIAFSDLPEDHQSMIRTYVNTLQREPK